MPLQSSHHGTDLKTFFTISPSRELHWRMIPLLAAAIAVSSPQNVPRESPQPVVQARATVRIVSAARLHWGEKGQRADLPPARATTIQTVNGPQAAQLIELE
jgi:hypothetical protein